MTGPQLTGLQQVSLRILNDGVYDPEKLRINCPLDHGAHNINPEYDLGQLSRLPTELQDMVLDELDVNSLFTFRRVNQSAMNTVNKLAEYQKVMEHASNAIRMAIAIRTAHTFTIKQLFLKLCQRYCDGAGCEKLAPYIDVFTLTRRCLSIDKGCRGQISPLNHSEASKLAASKSWLDCTRVTSHDSETHIVSAFTSSQLLRNDRTPFAARHFYALAGTYGNQWTLRRTIHAHDDPIFYDFHDLKAAIPDMDNEQYSTIERAFSSTIDTTWNSCSTTAPWLSKTDMGAEYGVFCDQCSSNYTDRNLTSVRETLAILDGHRPREYYTSQHRDLYHLPFMRLEDFAEHARESEAYMVKR